MFAIAGLLRDGGAIFLLLIALLGAIPLAREFRERAGGPLADDTNAVTGKRDQDLARLASSDDDDSGYYWLGHPYKWEPGKFPPEQWDDPMDL